MKRVLLSALAILAATGLWLAPPLEAQSVSVGVAVTAAAAQYPQQYPGQYPQRPTSPRRYPNDPYARGRDASGADDYAYSNGFRDGYDKGFDDARHRNRYDARRHRWYRGGDRGYDRDYRMSRGQYGDIYRQGFLRGYDSGYRDAQRGYRGPRYDGRTPVPYPRRRGPNWGGWSYFRF